MSMIDFNHVCEVPLFISLVVYCLITDIDNRASIFNNFCIELNQVL